MNRFLCSFWSCFLVVLASAFLVATESFSSIRAGLPPRPSFPFSTATFVNDYSYEGCTCHYLFRFGLFGMGDRLRRSDVLLLGSSHVEFGFSAAQLSRELSANLGRPVRAYNLGASFGDGLPFTRTVLASNHLRAKACLVDLYVRDDDHLSPFAAKVEGKNVLGAYAAVCDLWLRVIDDWVLDAWLPRISRHNDSSGAGMFTARRMLDMVDTRAWGSGDSVEFWTPRLGLIYTHPELGKVALPGSGAPRITPRTISNRDRAALTQKQERVIFTLLPWNSKLVGHWSGPEPFVPIPEEGLSFFDSYHLDAPSRTIATDRLLQGLLQTGRLESWLGGKNSEPTEKK